jgi:hypothetical protein
LSIGFIVNQNGTYLSHVGFTLSGTVCATAYSS